LNKNLPDQERECPSCRRIYEAADVPDDLCPFCEPETHLHAVGGGHQLIADLFSIELGWPRGQASALVTVSRNYMDAQLTKAQLESSGIPVLIESKGPGRIYGLAMGDLAECAVFVPQNFLEQARQVLEGV
jgi:hypothetical protein